MKKLSILFLSLVALATTVVSCSKDEAPSIVAKWTYDTFTHTTAGTTTAPAPVTDASCTVKSYMDLKSAGALEYQSVDNTDQTNPCAATKSTGTYTYENNTLHITSDGASSDYIVSSLTSSKLIIKTVNPNDATEYITITLVK